MLARWSNDRGRRLPAEDVEALANSLALLPETVRSLAELPTRSGSESAELGPIVVSRVLCDVEKGQQKARVGMPKGKLAKRDRMQQRACVMEDSGNAYG
jgi:hypothetical protein